MSTGHLCRPILSRVKPPPSGEETANEPWRQKITSTLIGPGGTNRQTLPSLGDSKWVIDADALFMLPARLTPNCIITPHEGEFERMEKTKDLRGSKLEKAVQAATLLNTHIVLKGSETIIAAPNGRAVTNNHANPYLASAGTGDALSGIITGLLAQGMPIFETACAAVWIHGEAGRRIGPGLIATDITGKIPAILKEIVIGSRRNGLTKPH